MLYVLPPPRAPSPPSPWDSIPGNNQPVNGGGGGGGNSNTFSSSNVTSTTNRHNNNQDNCNTTINSSGKNGVAWAGTADQTQKLRSARFPRRSLSHPYNAPRNCSNGRLDGDGLSCECHDDIVDTNRNPKSLNECYFAGKGAALVLPITPCEAAAQQNMRKSSETTNESGENHGHSNGISISVVNVDDDSKGSDPQLSSTNHLQPKNGDNSQQQEYSSLEEEDLLHRHHNQQQQMSNQHHNHHHYQSSNIQRHLQSMFYLLRQEETLKMAVKLESVHPNRTRYLVVVSRLGTRNCEESCLLGIDCNERTTVGLVLCVMADTTIRLDGDGGFSVSVCGRHHIFKPVSVQAMWSALQTLHKVSSKARVHNYFQGGGTHQWVGYYGRCIESDRSCLNEWHAMDNLESRRPPSPDSIRSKPTQHVETEQLLRTTLKEIMMSVDLDEVTSKYIRSRLEEDLDLDFGEYKSFIDQEMLTILGQMDAPTEIFDHVYLGSEWNASNYEELQRNGVGHILNVTREIDNFFPGTFDYLNVRVYDDDKTDLLKHWDDTFKYISKARNSGSKVLVHCKMGISRSASVVIAYAMKAYNWDFKTAFQYVREKRTCIKPNTSFLTQLETYQGILDAMKNKEKLQRSKSETNLKEKDSTTGSTTTTKDSTVMPTNQQIKEGQQQQHLNQQNHIQVDVCSKTMARCVNHGLEMVAGVDLKQSGNRPKSWSPDCLDVDGRRRGISTDSGRSPVSSLSLEDLSQKASNSSSNRNVLLPCDNGESYSVSPNQIVHLPGQDGVNSNHHGARRKIKISTNLATVVAQTTTATSKCVGVNVQLRPHNLSRHSSWGSGDGSSSDTAASNLAVLSKLSVSAPETSKSTVKNSQLSGSLSRSATTIPTNHQQLRSTSSSSTVRQHRNFLENLRKRRSSRDRSRPSSTPSSSTATTGIVKNLKKEFEAKTTITTANQEAGNPVPNSPPPPANDAPLTKVNSLPSSPVCVHHQEKKLTKDETNFRNLLGLFEGSKQGSMERQRYQQRSGGNLRHSCIEMGTTINTGKLPPQPTATSKNSSLKPSTTPGFMVAATVIAKAAKKQQQQQQQFGKTHPLARLNLKNRHSSPVFNTM